MQAIATSKGEDIDVYRVSMTPTELRKLRRSLAKRANQRLIRLERATSKVTGESLSEIGAAPIAQSYLSRTGRRRFTEKLESGLSYEQERQEIIKIQAFLKSKTSLVSGVREVERKRIEVFESGKYGSYKDTGKLNRKLNFSSTKEFYDFFHSSTFKELMGAGFSSEQIIERYDEAMERFKGKNEEALNVLEDALQTFREKGSITLKDLQAAVKGKKLT